MTIIVALGYVAAMATVFYVFRVVQNNLNDHPMLAFTSLIFLPHGIRILAAYLVGVRSIIPLAIGALLSKSLGLDAGGYPLALMIPGVVCSYLSFKIFEFSGADFKPGFGSVRQWRGLVLVSFLAALINGLGIVIISVMSGLDENEVLPRLFGYVVGDTIGAFVLLWGMMRLGRLYRYKVNAK